VLGAADKPEGISYRRGAKPCYSAPEIGVNAALPLADKRAPPCHYRARGAREERAGLRENALSLTLGEADRRWGETIAMGEG